MKFALLKERKSINEARVLFSPTQLKYIIARYPEHSFVVESAENRVFKNVEYEKEGIPVLNDVRDSDVFLGIKEQPLHAIIEEKIYFFFSHTTKMQPHNKWYLQGLKDKNITFFDYENFTNAYGKRLIAFGNNAGLIGAYHAIRTFGLKKELFTLPLPSILDNENQLITEINKVNIPRIKIIVTGTGNVGQGITQLLTSVGITRVSSQSFLSQNFNTSVFTVLTKKEYLISKKSGVYNETEFLETPSSHKSDFVKYTQQANILIAGHYHHKGMPLLFTQKDSMCTNFKISTIADISCDIFTPLPTCLRVSTPKDPIYGYNKITGDESDFKKTDSIAIMAIDNLPCELPKTSSINFGNQFISQLLPLLMTNLEHSILQKACVIKQGKITSNYNYLEAFLQQDSVKAS